MGAHVVYSQLLPEPPPFAGRRYYVAQGMYSTTTECVSCRTQLQQSGRPSGPWMVLGGVDSTGHMFFECDMRCSTDSGSLTSELAIPRGTTSWIWHLVISRTQWA